MHTLAARIAHLFTALLCLSLVACGPKSGGAPLPYVPERATSAFVVDSLADLQSNLTGLLANIEGTSGLLELIAARVGLDLRSREGLEALGLDISQGVALFMVPGPKTEATDEATNQPNADQHNQDALVLVVSVREPERFQREFAQRMTQGLGLQAVASSQAEAVVRSFEGEQGKAALTVTSDRVGVVVLQLAGSPEEVLTQLVSNTDAPLMNSERMKRARDLYPHASARLLIETEPPSAPRSLGLARGAVNGVLNRLGTWEGGLSLGETGFRLEVQSASATAEQTTFPSEWVTLPSSKVDSLIALFPRTTTGLLRLRLNMEKVRDMPNFIRKLVLPDQIPGFENAPLPGLNDLVDVMEGDLVVGLLGLKPKATFAQIARSPRSNLHLALAATLRPGKSLEGSVEAIVEQLYNSSWVVSPIKLGEMKGHSFARDGQHYALLSDATRVLILVGESELDGFQGVQEGRLLPFASFAEGKDGDAVIARSLGLKGDTSAFFGLSASPLRLTRELAARNMPPYFIKIINDLRFLSAALSLREDHLIFSLELDL